MYNVWKSFHLLSWCVPCGWKIRHFKVCESGEERILTSEMKLCFHNILKYTYICNDVLGSEMNHGP